jgi:ketosteroid isomerase-like protein
MDAEANKALIERFYAALGRCDGADATACYAPGAHFRDPAFGDLEGNEVGAMWRMLAGYATDLEIELRECEADEDSGTAHWIARLTFPNGRPVVKDVRASFHFAEGLIADHVDDFDLRSLAKQALGPMGTVVAAHPLLRRKARALARRQLNQFIAAEKDKASA